jgi:hypothetical protein
MSNLKQQRPTGVGSSEWLGIMVLYIVLRCLCIQSSLFATPRAFFGNRRFVVYKPLTVFDTLPFLSHT